MQVDAPVWYVLKEGELIGVIALESPDTYHYRKAARAFKDCTVWCRIPKLGWGYMNTNFIQSSIWVFTSPPDVVVLAELIRG